MSRHCKEPLVVYVCDHEVFLTEWAHTLESNFSLRSQSSVFPQPSKRILSWWSSGTSLYLFLTKFDEFLFCVLLFIVLFILIYISLSSRSGLFSYFLSQPCFRVLFVHFLSVFLSSLSILFLYSSPFFIFRIFYPSFVSVYSLFIFCPSFSLLLQFYSYFLPPPFFLEYLPSLFKQFTSSFFFCLLFNYSSTSSSSFLFRSVLLIFPCYLQLWLTLLSSLPF